LYGFLCFLELGLGSNILELLTDLLLLVAQCLDPLLVRIDGLICHLTLVGLFRYDDRDQVLIAI